jgi:hypothetical protein
VTALQAVRDGILRVSRAPAIMVSVWLMTLAVSLPLTVVVRQAIERQLGASLEAHKVADGADFDWIDEFQNQSSGVAATLTPAVIGFGAVVANASAFLDGEPPPLAIAAAAVTYAACWMFLAGGIIDRYARDRAVGVNGFCAASGVFFFRFLRLGVLSAAVYGLLFTRVHPMLFDGVLNDVTRDFTSERGVFFVRLALYGLFALMLAGCSLVFDYARVRAVVEDRRSMLGALLAALGFIRRNAGAVAGVYAANAALFAGVLALYAAAAEGIGSGAPWTWAAFVVGQLYIWARLWLKLVWWSSETALFQGRLAHAGYVNRPAPRWPDAPAVEAVSI